MIDGRVVADLGESRSTPGRDSTGGDADSAQGNGLGKAAVNSLRALAQPWTLALVLILLLNDHVLRARWPSWVTGKLGDVVWLGFAPLVVAVPLVLGASALARWKVRTSEGSVGGALPPLRRSRSDGPRRFAVPRRGATRPPVPTGPVPTASEGLEHWPVLLSMALVGYVFAAVKASPAAAAWFRNSFRAVFGWTPLLVSDPTDLLTLPALWIAWRLWGRSAAGMPHANAISSQAPGTFPSPRHLDTRSPRRAWWVLGLAALATLANSGPPDTGLTCLVLDGERVVAGARYVYAYTSSYASDDGGLTWSVLAGESIGESPWQETDGSRCVDRGSTWILIDEAEGLQFRFTQGEGIERSLDAGQTWRPSLMLSGEEARQAYYQATRTTIAGGAGPHDAVVDPATGNVIVAMGHEGVLVLPRAGRGGQDATGDAWRWVAVGEYRFEPITRVGQMLALLQDEAGLALAAACVAVALCAWWLMKWPGRVVTGLLAVAIVAMLPAVRPATVSGYGGAAVTLMTIGIAVVAVILAVVGAIRMYVQRGVGAQHAAPPLWLALAAVATGVVCLVPFVLWAVGPIAVYSVAAWIAVVLTGVAWAVCVQQNRRP